VKPAPSTYRSPARFGYNRILPSPEAALSLALLLLGSAALAGYGDPVDGHPSRSERALHLWTNAARVAPDAFEDFYALGGCSVSDFSADERTPKSPLRWQLELNRAARSHSEDMETNGFVGHDSFDGTLWADRLASYYPFPTVGENVAQTYGGTTDAVFSVWMCSRSGHRGNIMSDTWEELGTGTAGMYFTQDFGARGVSPRPLSMGLHFPSDPEDEVVFRVDWTGETAPDALVVVLDGWPLEGELEYGVPENGVYATTVLLDAGGGCHAYWFKALLDGEETRFPEEGSYGWGDCAFDDPDARWVDRQSWGDEVPKDGCGCAYGGAVPWAVALLPLFVLRRRVSRPASSG